MKRPRWGRIKLPKARIHLNEMVDPNYVIVASIEKKFLPEKKK